MGQGPHPARLQARLRLVAEVVESLLDLGVQLSVMR